MSNTATTEPQQAIFRLLIEITCLQCKTVFKAYLTGKETDIACPGPSAHLSCTARYQFIQNGSFDFTAEWME